MKKDYVLGVLQLLQDHADKLYDLVDKSNPGAKIFRGDGNYTEADKAVSSAMWHSHELHKYLEALRYHLERK